MYKFRNRRFIFRKTVYTDVCKTFYSIPVYTAFFLKINPRVRNTKKTSKIKNSSISVEKVYFVGLYCIIILQCIVQKIAYNITVISLALLYALHTFDVTSYDNSCSTTYTVRAICETVMPETNRYKWLTFIACITPDTYVFVVLEELKHRL